MVRYPYRPSFISITKSSYLDEDGAPDTVGGDRQTSISVGLTNDVNIKWLAGYCGTSGAIIEKHCSKYLRNDADEQLARPMEGSQP